MLKALSKSNRYVVPLGNAKFHFRALSGREFRKVEAMQSGKSLDPIYEAIATAIVGWEGVIVDEPAAIDALNAESVPLRSLDMPGLKFESPGAFEVPFNPKLLDLILSAEEVVLLFGLMLEGNRPTKAEAGKSDSPAPSAQA